MNKKNDILLSVCVRTHNQERFIHDALDSVLCQKTNFPFEIIISDDASTDGTIDILKEYQTLHSDKIRLTLNETNIGGPENLKRVIEASTAKYITCLDGDDFYTDDYKLQKQLDFLEIHSEYAACFHNTWNVDANGRKYGLFNPLDFASIHDAREFIRKCWFVPIHSAMLRRKYIEFPKWYGKVKNDDYVVHLLVVKHAPYYYMPDVMVAYRHHDNNSSRVYDDIILTDTQLYMVLENMKSLYPDEYESDFEAQMAEYKAEVLDIQMLQKHPWRKWLRRKTYTRVIKGWLRKFM